MEPEAAEENAEAACDMDILERIEQFKYPVIASAKGYIIRRVPAKRVRKTADATYNMLESRLSFMDTVPPSCRWFLLKYQVDANASVDALFQLLHGQLSAHDNHGLCVARIGNDVVCLVKKNDYKAITSASLQLSGVQPIIYRFVLKGHGSMDAALRSALDIYTDATHDYVSNMSMDSNDKEYTIDELVRQCATLNSEQFQKLIADSKLTDKPNRCSFQRSLLKVVQEMLRIRTTPSISPMIIALADMKGKVQCFSEFRQDVLDLPLTVNDSTIAAHDATLRQYIYDPQVHQNLTLLLHGGTRMGKTEMAKSIAMRLAVKYKGQDAKFIMTNTLDALRNVQQHMSSGVPLVIDDTEPGNKAALVHTDPQIWKTILQIGNVASTRGRNDDVIVAPYQFKIITSNAESVDEWLHGLHCSLNHVAALKMRLASVHVVAPLWRRLNFRMCSASIFPSAVSDEQVDLLLESASQ